MQVMTQPATVHEMGSLWVQQGFKVLPCPPNSPDLQFDKPSVSVLLIFPASSLLQPVHLAQSSFLVEAFGTSFILDLELNQ